MKCGKHILTSYLQISIVTIKYMLNKKKIKNTHAFFVKIKKKLKNIVPKQSSNIEKNLYKMKEQNAFHLLTFQAKSHI